MGRRSTDGEKRLPSAAAADSALVKKPDMQATLDLLKPGRGTLEQFEARDRFTAAEKAALRRLAGR